MVTPTKKQKIMLDFIDAFVKGNGYSPTFREIMQALDYKSVSTVAKHIDNLIARGWLVKRDGEARSLEVVVLGDDSMPIDSSDTHKQWFESLVKQRELEGLAEEDLRAIDRTRKVLGIV